MQNACIKPYEYSSELGDQEVLVVEAQITNLQEELYVYLSFLKSYSNGMTYRDTLMPATGALVYIVDSANEIYLFYESASGCYVPENLMFIALPYVQYKLHIELQDGRKYESEYEEVSEAPEMRELVVSYDDKIFNEARNVFYSGYRLFVEADVPAKAESYYKFYYDEVWEIENWGYFYYKLYLDQKEFWEKNNLRYPTWPYDTLVPEICWKSYRPRRFVNIGEIPGEYSNSTFLHSLINIPLTNSRLNRRYAIEVNMMLLNSASGQYWKSVIEQKNYTGSIFDPVPAKIYCNVYCASNPQEQVAGFFTVGNSKKKRFFIDSSDLSHLAEYRSECIEHELYALNPDSWVHFWEDNSPCCFICDLCSDMSRVRPGFW